ncbi:peptidoglycan-binding protein [Candidatus Binatia bacterium]|nr:peptidoglycan-binding protein [Candidatus Binatia bacterium]
MLSAGVLVLGLVLPACSPEHAERRARAAAETMRDSLPDIDGAGRAQRISPEVIRNAQRQLGALHEYHGEISGELDAVTINAIQAFQRTQGLHDDGVLDARTRERLAAATNTPP